MILWAKWTLPSVLESLRRGWVGWGVIVVSFIPETCINHVVCFGCFSRYWEPKGQQHTYGVATVSDFFFGSLMKVTLFHACCYFHDLPWNLDHSGSSDNVSCRNEQMSTYKPLIPFLATNLELLRGWAFPGKASQDTGKPHGSRAVLKDRRQK